MAKGKITEYFINVFLFAVSLYVACIYCFINVNAYLPIDVNCGLGLHMFDAGSDVKPSWLAIPVWVSIKSEKQNIFPK